jgi:hypothetical protein
MKLPFPRHLLSRSSQGSIQEDGDSELILPNTILPGAIVSTPLDLTAAASPTATLQQSFVISQSAVVNGLNIAQTLNFPRLGKGLWYLDFICCYSFAGTVNGNAQELLQITKPDGTTFLNIFWGRGRVTSPITVDNHFSLWMMLPDEAPRFQLAVGATVALDQLFVLINLTANKLW